MLILIIESFFVLLGISMGALLLFGSRPSFAFRFLGLHLLCASLLTIVQIFFNYSFFRVYPHLFRIWEPLSLISPVALYLFYRMVLYNEYELRKWDWIFFIPALLLALYHLPFYLLTTAEKKAIIDSIYELPNPSPDLGTNTIQTLYINLVKTTWTLSLFAYTCWLVYRYPKISNQELIKHNPVLWSFLKDQLVIKLIGIIYVLLFFSIVSNPNDARIFEQISTFAALFFPIIYILKYPYILRGFILPENPDFVKNILPESPALYETTEDNTVPIRAKSLTPKEKDLLTHRMNRIETFLLVEKPYLQGSFTLKELSRNINLPERVISNTIKEMKQLNYTTYINSLRIRYLIEKLNEDEKWRSYNVESLCFSIGFNSLNSFYLSFRYFYGMAPKEYINTQILPTIHKHSGLHAKSELPCG